MTVEALLAYAHLLAILTAVVFIASETALCRPQWLNAAVVERLVVVDRIYLLAMAAVFATGVARMALGTKGLAWYGAQPLLWVKVALFAVMGLMAARATRGLRRWREALRAHGALPAADDVRALRRWIMRQAHVLPLIPLPAVFLARGFG